MGGLSYFAGAEKKDERVLVPDLGSLTSVYDRYVNFTKWVLALWVKVHSWFSIFFFFYSSELASFKNGFWVSGLANCSII